MILPYFEFLSEVDPDAMPLTNTLIHNEPYLMTAELSTSKEKVSYFLIYSKLNGTDIGCEFTHRRKGKFPRYECRKCRSLCNRDKTSGLTVAPEDKEAAVQMDGHSIKEIKKLTHHKDCVVEYAGTAFARTVKNEAVVFKSKYGGSSKQVYDTHSNILSISAEKHNLTARDVAVGFKTFEHAQSALKKSSKRKTALNPKKVEIQTDVIDKMTTKIIKSTALEPDDFYLIGQDVEAGVIVLGSRFLVERFFKSQKAMSDGTFQMTPVGFKQCYMLWHIVEGKYKDEKLARSKSILDVCFILKGKSQEIYKIAFKILDEYRKSENIPEPSFEEYLTDDEPAVRNVVGEFYADTTFSICFFHLNQNIVKCLVEHKLSNFVKKCKEDEQLWFYGQIKQILVILLLKEEDIVPTFKYVSASIMKFIEEKFVNPYEIEQFQKFFDTIEDRYFSCPEKIKLSCKYKKTIRTTNPVEAGHRVFNKSSIVPKHGTLANFIQAMRTIDLQYRSSAIDFEMRGASALPKKRNLYAKQQAVIEDCTTKLEANVITVYEFLKECAKVMIHEKYFKLIEEATKRFEDQNVPQMEEDVHEFDETIAAIFATEDTTNKRVITLCKKYFGPDWLN